MQKNDVFTRVSGWRLLHEIAIFMKITRLPDLGEIEDKIEILESRFWHFHVIIHLAK